MMNNLEGKGEGAGWGRNKNTFKNKRTKIWISLVRPFKIVRKEEMQTEGKLERDENRQEGMET